MRNKGIFQNIFGKTSSAVLSACIACSEESTAFFQNGVSNRTSGEGEGCGNQCCFVFKIRQRCTIHK